MTRIVNSRMLFFCLLLVCLVLASPAAFAQSLVQNTNGTISALNGAVTVGALNNVGTVSVSISGTWSGTLAFQATDDSTNWYAVTGVVPSTNVGVLSTTANGLWQVRVSGYAGFRVYDTAYSSGTATVQIRKSQGGTPQPEWLNSTGPTSQITADSSVIISVAAAATQKLVSGVAGKQIYITGYTWSGDTTATVGQLEYGTGTTCGTGTTTISGAYKVAANGAINRGGPTGLVLAPVPAGKDLCIVATTGALAGDVSYTQF
jgi:hypothetical protein